MKEIILVLSSLMDAFIYVSAVAAVVTFPPPTTASNIAHVHNRERINDQVDVVEVVLLAST
jgi:hypothetical protein